jgi:hypothetical protein
MAPQPPADRPRTFRFSKKDIPRGEGCVAHSHPGDISLSLTEPTPVLGMEQHQQDSTILGTTAVDALHRLSKCVAASHLPGHIALKTCPQIPPDRAALSQLLIPRAPHSLSSSDREAIREFRLDGYDLKATVGASEAQQKIDKGPISEPVGTIHAGKLEICCLQPSKIVSAKQGAK